MILTRFNGILFHGILMGFNGTQWGWMGYNGIHNKHQPTIWWVYPPIVMSKTGMIMSTSGLRGVTDPWVDLPGAHLYCISSHDQRSKTSYLVYSRYCFKLPPEKMGLFKWPSMFTYLYTHPEFRMKPGKIEDVLLIGHGTLFTIFYSLSYANH